MDVLEFEYQMKQMAVQLANLAMQETDNDKKKEYQKEVNAVLTNFFNNMQSAYCYATYYPLTRILRYLLSVLWSWISIMYRGDGMLSDHICSLLAMIDTLSCVISGGISAESEDEIEEYYCHTKQRLKTGYENRERLAGCYFRLRQRINTNNRIDLDLLNIGSNYDVDNNTKDSRKTNVYIRLMEESGSIQAGLLRVFKEFHHEKLKDRKDISDDTIRENIKKMFGVIASIPSYGYVFPVYIFFMFIRRFDIICSSNETKDAAFAINLKFTDTLRKKRTAREYAELYYKIYEAVCYPPKSSEQEKDAIWGLSLFPTPDIEAIYNAIDPEKHLSEQQRSDYRECFESLLYSKLKKSETSKITKELNRSPEGECLLAIWRMQSETVFFPLQYGVLPSSQGIHAIRRAFAHISLHKPQLREQYDANLKSEKFPQKENDPKLLWWCYQSVECAINMPRHRISNLAFRLETRFQSFYNEKNPDFFDTLIQELFQHIALAFAKTPPHWIVRKQDDYNIAPDLRRSVLSFSLKIADYKWKTEDISFFLLNNEDDNYPRDHIPYDFYRNWIQTVPTVSKGISHFFSSEGYSYSKKEQHYLLTQIFQESWRSILLNMQERLIKLLLPSLDGGGIPYII